MNASNLATALLTTRERDVLLLLVKGFKIAEIGRILVISPHTVGSHVKKIYEKLDVRSRAEAVYESLQTGILDGHV